MTAHASSLAPPPQCSKLGCAEGRSAERWVDFNLYGHQIVGWLPTESSPAAPGMQCHASPHCTFAAQVAHLVDGYSAASSHNAGG